MTVDEAMREACTNVGIVPPKGGARHGRWTKTDTLSGKNGKGDGRVIANDASVTAFNWQTGQTSTVFMNGEPTKEERRQIARDIERRERVRRERAAVAAGQAVRIIAASMPAHHPYLISKGFRDERALVVEARAVAEILGERSGYLIPAGARHGIVLPARHGHRVTSVQLIWEDGTKKFLYGGDIDGSCHRISTGACTWLCEGFATGLSVRAALLGLKMRSTVLCCFSAANVVSVARQTAGRAFIATDNDKPLQQYGWLGTGEYFARQTDLPYGMPPIVGTDFNDIHQQNSIFAVQQILTSVMARGRAK